MKSIKMMLLGIALLIVAVIGNIFWFAGSWIGAVMFFVGLISGLFLCFRGFFSDDK